MCWFVPLIIAGVSAVSQMQQAGEEAKAANTLAEYEARESERKAALAAMQAQSAHERGEAEREDYMRGFAQKQGGLVATQGASGLVIGSGTGGDTLASSAALARLDADAIRHNAALEAYNYREQGRNATARANYSRAGGLMALQGAKTKKGNLLLSAAGSMAKKL